MMLYDVLCVERFHDEIFFTSFQCHHEYVDLCFTFNYLVIVIRSVHMFRRVGVLARRRRACDLIVLFHFTRSRYRCSRDWEDNM
jgi:hypothetical protein